MSGIVKVLLLLAVLACISKAQRHQSDRCLCNRVQPLPRQTSNVRDIHIYPVTTTCTRVEIVVTMNDNYRFCLNPKLRRVKKLVDKIFSRNLSTSASAVPSLASTSKITTQA